MNKNLLSRVLSLKNVNAKSEEYPERLSMVGVLFLNIEFGKILIKIIN